MLYHTSILCIYASHVIKVVYIDAHDSADRSWHSEIVGAGFRAEMPEFGSLGLNLNWQN